jgi:hypothetical protein
MRWDTGIVAPIDAPADYPRPGQHVRWRYRLGPLPMILHDRPTEVVAEKTLRASIQLGPYAFDEIYTLTAETAARTALSASLSLSSNLPLVGPWLERWPGASLARATVRQSLAAIKAHCEAEPSRPDAKDPQS